MTLKDKVIIVTGAATGIGRYAALGLARQGAHVICVGRSTERLAPALEQIKSVGGSAEGAVADLSLMADVHKLAEQVGGAHPRIDALVNNAGVWLSRREVTPDGFEKTWAVNVLAPHLLAQLLLEPLRAANGRVVNVSSEEHLNGRIWWEDTQFESGFAARHAYRQSKLAITMLTAALAEREPGITANSLHPGIVGTELFRNFPAFIRFWIKLLMRTPESGAEPVIHLAADPGLKDVTGQFFVRGRRGRPHGLAMNEPSRARLWELVTRQLS
jgi:NAD(P)-dependent dehydrogenase (short-subunit alcohol dehydrogenase family)